MADTNATSLLDYRFMPHRNAGDGTMGLGDVKDGSKGADLILPVPLGTVIFAAVGAQGRPKRPGEQLADLRHNGDKFVAAAGGAGGLGKLAIMYGYNKYNYPVMILAVIVLVVLVQLFQSIGTRLSVKLDKRIRK